MLFLIKQDTYFDDDSGEVVISSLRLGDDQGRYAFEVMIGSTLDCSRRVSKKSGILI